MSRPRFSKRTLRLLGDELASDWTLRTIGDLFEDHDVPLGPASAGDGGSGQRRSLMNQYLASLDLDSDEGTRALLPVISEVLAGVLRSAAPGTMSPDGAERWAEKWTTSLRRDGFQVDESAGVVSVSGGPSLTEGVLYALEDASAIRDHLERLGDTVETDPRLAVSTAKALIESTAKVVLSKRGVAYTDREKLPPLVTRAQESLGLTRKSAKSRPDGDDPALLGVLGSLATLAQNVAEIRNKVGVDHGRESVGMGAATPRPARRRRCSRLVSVDARHASGPGRTLADARFLPGLGG